MTCFTCSTCAHSTMVSYDITSPGGFNWVAVERYHCKLHDLHAEDDDICDDYAPETPAQQQPTQGDP